MRRTVKAWAPRLKSGTLVVSQARYTRLLSLAAAGPAWANALCAIVPVKVTYDDGRPAPRKRTKGGRRV